MTKTVKYHRSTILIDKRHWRAFAAMAVYLQKPVSVLLRAAIRHALSCEQFKDDLVKTSQDDIDRVKTFKTKT